VAAPLLCRLGRPAKIAGDVLVRTGRRRGQVPRPPRGVIVALQGTSQRPMRGRPRGERRCVIDGRPHERVAQHDALGAIHPGQPSLLSRLQRFRLHTEIRSGPEDHRRVGSIVRGGDQQQRLSRLR
jgi:hypothetical protein